MERRQEIERIIKRIALSKLSSPFWQPREILRQTDQRESSTQVVMVRTDLGDAYLKVMGNPQGEHALVREWVGSQLARWFGLLTFEFGTIEVKPEELGIISFLRTDCQPRAGPAFISKADRGQPWGGSKRELERIANKEDITKLVILDTWIRNQDRYFQRPLPEKPRINRDNVFLSEEAPEGQFLLRAIDHSDCFTNGKEILKKHLGIAETRDEAIYGLFPEFRDYLDRAAANQAVARLGQMNRATAEAIVVSIPLEWDVRKSDREALADFIVQHAAHVSRTIMTLLWPPPQPSLFEDSPEKSS